MNKKKVYILKPARDFDNHEVVKKQKQKRADFEKRNGKLTDEQWAEYQRKFIK